MRSPVLGSAAAETSEYERPVHPVSACQDGFGSCRSQPVPVEYEPSDHADSAMPRPPLPPPAGVSSVPPTATTDGNAAG